MVISNQRAGLRREALAFNKPVKKLRLTPAESQLVGMHGRGALERYFILKRTDPMEAEKMLTRMLRDPNA